MPKGKRDYAMAQIYLIKSKSVINDGWIYVGSSCRDLSMVFSKHIYESNQYAKQGKSHVIYDKIRSAWDFYHLVLYENYPCDNIEQLRKREIEVRDLLGGVSNRQTLTEKKKKRAQYYQENKEVILDRANKYNKEHKRKDRNAYFREYRKRKKAATASYGEAQEPKA